MRSSAGHMLVNLLPEDNEWLAGSGDDGEVIDYTAGSSSCEIRIHVRRNHVVFFVKDLVVVVIIVEAALLTLRLNPLVPPLLGGRFAMHITAMLTVALRASKDLEDEIGRSTELLWVDWFYVFQCEHRRASTCEIEHLEEVVGEVAPPQPANLTHLCVGRHPRADSHDPHDLHV